MKARRGDGRPIEASFEIDGRRFRIGEGGMFEEAPPPTDRGTRWPLPAHDDRQVSIVVAMLKQRRLPPEAIIDGHFEVVDAPPEPDPQGLADPQAPVSMGMEWNYPAARRLQFKMACDLLAHSRPEFARAEKLRPARDFARHGVGDFRLAFDASTDASRLPEVSAPYRHVLEVWTHRRVLHTRFALFSELRFVGTLTTHWDGPPFRISHSFNCLAPNETSLELGDGDGDAVVNRSPRLARAELLEASARLSATMKRLTTNVVAYRAEALTIEELYRRIKPLFDADPWKTG
jgi:hypothetical protein